MTSAEIFALIVTAIGVFSFAAIFTILYLSYAKAHISEIKSGKKDIEILDEVIYERQEKVKRRRKMTGLIRTVIFYVIIITIVPFFIFSIVNRVSGNITMIGNKSVMVIATDSMSYKNEANTYLTTRDNQIQQYDLIVLEKVKEKDIKKYQVIAYRNDKNIIIVHRIVEDPFVKDGKTHYITRGDIYDSSKTDEYKPSSDDVVGRYTGKRIAGVGLFILFLQSYAGIITVISLVYCLLMIDRVAGKIDKAQKERVDKLEQALDYASENSTDAISIEYTEKIYYKGYEYSFNEDGFVDKTEIKEGPYLEKSNNMIIKDLTNASDETIKHDEIVVDNEKQGEQKHD